jgi:hypothetical protein
LVENLKGRPWNRWEGSIRTDVRKMVWEDEDWMHLAQEGDQWQGLVDTVMKLRVPKGGEFLY